MSSVSSIRSGHTTWSWEPDPNANISTAPGKHGCPAKPVVKDKYLGFRLANPAFLSVPVNTGQLAAVVSDTPVVKDVYLMSKVVTSGYDSEAMDALVMRYELFYNFN